MKRWTAGILAGMILMFCVGLAAAENVGTDGYDEMAARLTIDRVFDAQTVLRDVARETPLVCSPGASSTADVYLKLESLQTTGSFKLRGAYYAVSRLSEAEKARGVVTCSAGNHAQGVASAAKAFGVKATIFIPESAPQEKIEATKSYGVEVRLEGDSLEEAKAAAEAFVEESGGVYIPPYDHLDVVAGQGTIAWEILREMPEVEAVIVPVGGGGLISGIAYTLKTLKPSCKVYGVEIESMNSMQRSIEAGYPVSVPKSATLADGIAVAAPSDLTFSLCRKYVDGIVTVSEEQVADAMLFFVNQHKLVVEGAGAVSLAAIQNALLPVEGKKVVCIVSGGNMDAQTLAELIERQMAKE